VLAARGVASRRKSEELIRAGRVSVDGVVVTELGTRVDPRSADIRVDGKRLRAQRMRYVALFKPTGYITTTSDEKGRNTVMSLIDLPERVYPVGRLDRDTEGLLLLTNDGEVANRIMHPRYRLGKEYTILTSHRPSDAAMQRVRNGIELDGRLVVPDEFRIYRETRDGVPLTITVHEGLNRVVRRLMEAVEIPILRLRRVRIGPIELGALPLGHARELSGGELTSLLEALRMDRENAPPARTEPAARKPAPRAPRASSGPAGPKARPAGRKGPGERASSGRNRER